MSKGVGGVAPSVYFFVQTGLFLLKQEGAARFWRQTYGLRQKRSISIRCERVDVCCNRRVPPVFAPDLRSGRERSMRNQSERVDVCCNGRMMMFVVYRTKERGRERERERGRERETAKERTKNDSGREREGG